MLEEDAVFEPGQRVWISTLQTEIEFFRRQHGRCVVKFKGIDSIAEAEQCVGSEVKIDADELPETKEGWFYTFQLKGCRVYAAGGDYLGTVTDVIDAGGTEILKVDLDEEETLIPFAQEYLRTIDLEEQRIEVDLPDGLRDLNK